MYIYFYDGYLINQANKSYIPPRFVFIRTGEGLARRWEGFS